MGYWDKNRPSSKFPKTSNVINSANEDAFQALVDSTKSVDIFLDPKLVQLENLLINTAADMADVPSQFIGEVMDVIAWHESDRTMDPSLIHYENPGRGMFGYEIQANETYPRASGSGRVAMNRLYSVIGGKISTKFQKGSVPKDMPDFMKEYFDETNPKGDVDFSKFSVQEQRILFLADHIREGSFLSNTSGGKLLKDGDFTEWWSKQHFKGPDPKKTIFDENWKLWEKEKNE